MSNDFLEIMLIFKLFITVNFKLFRVFDTAGQEEYKDVRTLAYPDTNVLIIAFSIVSRQSFENVKNVWMGEMKQYMKPLPKTVTYFPSVVFVHRYTF